MKILYLHGLHAQPGGTKSSFLRQHGHDVLEPSLPPFKFDESVRIAQAAFDDFCPVVVVGSSRGGAVAMNMDCRKAPLVLVAPAWNWNGMASTVKPGTLIMHAPEDEVVPLEHSRQLAEKSGLPAENLIVVGEGHRMNDPAALDALLRAVERAFKEKRR